MSNYPSPYPQYPQQPPGQPPYQPGYYGYPPQDPVASLVGRCKRAGILQIVLASISLLCGGCFAAVSPFMTLEMISQAQVTLPPGLDLEMLRKVYLILGIGLVIFGITLIILGSLEIRGSKGAAITAMVINILGALLMAVSVVVQLTQGNPLEALLNFAIIAILAWQIIWHVQAIGAAGQIAAARAQYYPQGQAAYGYQYGAQGQPYPQQQQQQWPGQQQQQQWPPQQQNPQQQQWPPPPQQPPPSS